MRLIAPLVVVCCLAGVGSQVAQAQSPTFQTGDVFVAIGGFSSGDITRHGRVLWYRKDGSFVKTLDTGQANTETAGMAFDASGNLYAAVFQANNVVKFDHSGNLLGTFGTGYNLDPESIHFDSSGNVYVGQADGTRQVLKFDASGSFITSFSPLTGPRGTDWIDLAADQKTLFYTSEGMSVRRFDLSTSTQLADFATGLPGRAFALRILPNGQVLVADTDRVVRLDTSGNVAQTYLASSLEPGSTCIGTSPCPLLFGLTLDPDGKSFWTADLFAGTVWKIDIATGLIDLTINTGFNDVGGVVVFHEITSSNSVNLLFSPSATPETLIATVGNPTDPAAQSLALTLASVTNAINVSVSFFYEPTEFCNGRPTGVGIADGVFEAGATEDQDFDGRLAGNFTYQTFTNGDRLVPHIIPSHNCLGVWVRVTATVVSTGLPAVEGVDYKGPVQWYYAWNSNPSLVGFPANPEYLPGWNNQNPQMYDRPGENTDIAFTNNITTFSKFNCTPTCVGTADPGTGGTTGKLNDIVVAAPPNPPTGTAPDTVELLVPVPRISPFPYLSGLPMLVAFELENESAEKSDPTALTPPHSVSVATLDPSGAPIPVQYPKGFPTTFTYNPFLKVYYIFLSPAPYKADGTTVYTLQIGSDLFPQPVNVKFVVKKFL